jgi:general secretion pathway protein M
MKAWFQALSERERTLVLLGGFVLIVLLGWFYGWKPLQAFKADLVRDIELTVEDRGFIEQAQTQVQILEQIEQSKPVYDTAQSVQSLVSTMLQFFQLNQPEILVRSEAKSKDIVNLQLENVQFDLLIRFIGTMEQQHNIKVSSMALVPSDTPGLTGAQVTLER